MEFDFHIGRIFHSELVRITPQTLNAKYTFLDNINEEHNAIRELIDRLGEYSAASQNLPQIVTTYKKFRGSNHVLYILSDLHANCIIGFLKTGKKRLFMHDNQGFCNETEPLCILDFFVHETCQRKGHGKKLFDYMLQVENVKPCSLAIDTPSKKMLQFLRRHYQLDNPIFSSNNFVIYPGFFDSPNNARTVYQDFRAVYSPKVVSTSPNCGSIDSGTSYSTLSQRNVYPSCCTQPHYSIPHTEVKAISATNTPSRNSYSTNPSSIAQSPQHKQSHHPISVTEVKAVSSAHVTSADNNKPQLVWTPSQPPSTKEVTKPTPTTKSSICVQGPPNSTDLKKSSRSTEQTILHLPQINSQTKKNYSVISSQELQLLRGLPGGQRFPRGYSYLNAVRNHNGHQKLW